MPYVPTWSTCQRACVPAWFTCQKRANFSFLCASVPINVPACHTACHSFNLACHCAKRCAKFQTFLEPNAKWNFYTLLLYKISYILLDIIVIHIICICIVNKTFIILHFYTSCHIKGKFVDFFPFYYFFLFCPLVRN